MGSPLKYSKSTAFSLVELFVIIALLAVLASMLMPSLKNTMAYGIQVQCKNNIKSISLAMGVYQHDYSFKFPYGIPLKPGHFGYNDFRKGKPHQELLLDYLADPKTNFICPEDPSPENYWWWKFWDNSNYDKVANGSSYMFSEHGVLGVAMWLDEPLSLNIIKKPSTYGYMADGRCFPNGWRWRNVDPNTPGLRLDWDHLGTVNFLFGDGHMETVDQIDAPDVRSDPR